jgi:hypothetical protein
MELDQPADFTPIPPNSQNIYPNPRTVRAQDLSWFNSRGGFIVKTSYDKCNQQIKQTKSEWNRLPPLPKTPFTAFVPVSNYDLYGVHCKQQNKCQSAYKQYVSDPYYDSRDCNILYDNDGYVDPN